MIFVALQGRTGNNLFQYAAGRAVADRLGTDLVLEGSLADPELEKQFRNILRFPLRASYRRSFALPKRFLVQRLGFGPGFWHNGPVHHEKGAGFDPLLGSVVDGTLLRGYFQSPANFQSSAEAIHRDLNPDAIQLPAASMRFAEAIQKQTTVSLHVRRGDYLKIASTDCLGPDYHDRAIRWFEDFLPNCRFCVFSDDITWCKQRFQENKFIHCDLPGSTSDCLHDMILMSKCHHHVIVNSSYSWWAAWLNPSKSKQVIAPSMWMTDFPSASLLPPDWITI